MPIERTDLDETAEQREAKETAAEARRQELESRALDERIKRERAEAALEEARRVPVSAAGPTGPTEEQWRQAEEQTGKTRQQIQAEMQQQAAVVDARMKPVLDEVKSAREEARAAKKELDSLKSRKGLDAVESDFYEKNPALKAHKSAVEEVLSTYSDRDSVDATTYQKRLQLAQDVVKGRLKESMRNERRTNDVGSRRLEGGDEDLGSDEGSGFDPKGTGNRGAALLMEEVHQNFGSEARFDDSVEVWKKFQDEEGRGVTIDSSEDILRARSMIQRGVAGGKAK